MNIFFKIINFIKHQLDKDKFYFLSKNRKKHLKYIKLLEKKYNKIEDYTRIANYKVPNKILNLIKRENFKVLISGGVEFHIEFEDEISKRYNKFFHLFEIDNRSINWFNLNYKNNKRLKIFNYGISDNNVTVDCFGSEEMSFSSSMNNNFIENHNNNFVFINKSKVLRLNKILENINKKEIDLLKLDIEGEAIKVIEDSIRLNIYPKIILCELERPKHMDFELYKQKVENLLYSIEQKYNIIVSRRDDEFNAYTIELWMVKSDK